MASLSIVGTYVRCQTFTDEQRQWLKRIRAHPIENLSVDREDFEAVPIFEREGGWTKAARVFGGQLLELVKKLNKEFIEYVSGQHKEKGKIVLLDPAHWKRGSEARSWSGSKKIYR